MPIHVFVSHSNKDLKRFEILKIKNLLENNYFHDIECELAEFSAVNIPQFMNDRIRASDIFLIFCSENALKSRFVTIEWAWDNYPKE
ncbi:MAG: toll/interleukin-1 receptor domain-containing protein [Candidatus Hermodarchaeota archaeon]